MSERVGDAPWLERIIANFPGAQCAFRDDWKAWSCTVAGKIFALRGADGLGRDVLSLKGPPAQNAALRDEYPAIIPGWNLNKQHWVSVLIDDAHTLPEGLMPELVEESYLLVFGSLTRAQQREFAPE